MAYPFDFESFDIPGLRPKKRFDDFLNPGLMGSGGDNPYAGLFNPQPQQSEIQPQFSGMFRPPTLEQIGMQSTVNPQSQSSENDDNFGTMFENMRKHYNPETEASNRFNQMIDQFPQREGPSLGRAFVAAGVGLGKGGIKDAQTVLNEPNERKLADWKTKAEPAYQAANLERQGNVNERQLLGQMITADTASKRTAEAERKYRAEILSRDAIAAGKKETADVRAAAYKRKEEGWEIKEEGSRVKAYMPPDAENPKGRTIDLGPSGGMDRQDLEDLKGRWGVKKAEATGASAVTIAGIRELETVSDEAGNIYTYNPQTKELNPGDNSPSSPVGRLRRIGTDTKPNPKTPTEPNETQQRIGRAEKARRYLNTDPELANYIKFTGTNEFTLSKPKRGLFSGVSAELQKKYDDMVADIYPESKKGVGPSNTAPPSTTKSKPIAGSNKLPTSPDGYQPGGPIGGSEPFVERSKSNPMNQRRTYPNGKIEYSSDGGRTWSGQQQGSSISAAPRSEFNAPTD